MRGDGSDGRRVDGGRTDASDLDTLHEPDAPVDTSIATVAEEWTDEELDGDGPDDRWDDDGLDGEPLAESAPDDALLEEDALYDDEYDGYDVEYVDDAEQDDEYDDEEYLAYDEAPADAEAAWPAPAAEPAPVAAVAATAGARGSTGPTIWAPGTAPGAWVPLGRPGFSNPLPTAAELARSGTRRRNLSVFSLAGLTNVLLLAYGVTAALLAAFTAALARRRGALDEVVGDAQRADALARSSYLVSVTTWGVVGLLTATVVASMIWSAVAARNHRMLSAGGSPSSVMAVVPWAVPLVNLVLPLRAVSEVAAGPTGHRSTPPVTVRWWIAWVASLLTVGYAVFAAATTSDGDQPDAITRLTLAAVVATVCFLYCFSQASVLFRHVARLQHDLAVELD